MLLDIIEPSSEKKEIKSKPAIGIDLGTTRSLVAFASSESDTKIADCDGKFYLDSAVKFENNSWIQTNDRTNSITSFKKYMGKDLETLNSNDKKHSDISTTEDFASLALKGNKTSPVFLSSVILKKLKKIADTEFNQEFIDAVITVPAYFDDAARADTLKAAKLAGINTLRLINEPTAAAIAYGIDNSASGTFMIYDFGGGTFDVSILQITDGIFKVIATNGDTMLGGDDIDHVVADYLEAKFKTSNYSSKEVLELAKKLKEQLSLSDEASVQLGKGNEISLTKEIFEELSLKIIDKTINIASETLNIADIGSSKLNGVILVGGSSRIPAVKTSLANKFQCKILDKIDPDKAVARGAAIQAYNLTHKSSSLLIDVIPLSIGIEVMGGLNDKIIERNTSIPFSTTKEFTTYADGQTGMKFHIVQGERELANDCRSLCSFEINNIPPQTAGTIKFEVVFSIDTNGILNITAHDEENDIYKEFVVNPSHGVSDSEVNSMLDDSLKYARQDVTAKLLIEASVHAQQLLDTVKKYIKQDSELLDQEEASTIKKQLNDLESSIINKDRNAIDKNVELLEKVTENFIHNRMNKYLLNNLEGKNISQIQDSFNDND